ncbi:hypothetical protein NL676_021287 [Syzygium grande]|nr:hypothetical protein NL676_021287 [Syzygium grande]
MPTKVTGLLKGLRCFSHMFDNRKEQELQIGFPTDGKQVAHIGWEGPSANALSWRRSKVGQQARTLLQNIKDAQDSLRHLLSTSFGSPQSSPSKQGSGAKKHVRQHCKSAASTDFPTQESSRPTQHSRRKQNLGLGVESSSHDAAMMLKQSWRRKSKGSSGGGST